MPLPEFPTLDAVPEPFRPYATEVDGKVVLDLVPGADMVGIKRKNAELIQREADIKAKFADIDPDEYKSLKASKGSAKDLDERLKAAAAEKATLEDQLTKLRTSVRNSTKRSEVTRALAAENANVALLEPLVMNMVDVEEVEGNVFVVIRTPEGGVRYRNGQGDRFSVTDLLQELKAKPEFQPAFMTKVGSGGDARPGSAGRQGVRLIDPANKQDVMNSLEDIRTGKARIAS